MSDFGESPNPPAAGATAGEDGGATGTGSKGKAEVSVGASTTAAAGSAADLFKAAASTDRRAAGESWKSARQVVNAARVASTVDSWSGAAWGSSRGWVTGDKELD